MTDELDDSLLTLADLLDHLGGIDPIRVRFRPSPGSATEADLIELNDRKGGVFELFDGVLVQKGSSLLGSIVIVSLSCLVMDHTRRRNMGIVSGSRGPMRLRTGCVCGPSMSYTSWGRIPGGRIPRDPVAGFPPDLAAELICPGNTGPEMARKRREYFAAGVRLVWEVDFESRFVDVYHGAAEATRVDEAGTLEGGDVIPEFSLPVSEVFAVLDRRPP